MIQGLLIEVKSEELASMLEAKRAHHAGRVEFYSKQLAQMQALSEGLRLDGVSTNNSSSRSPTEAIEESLKKHQKRAEYFDFMLKHVIPNEMYRLQENELSKLGLSEHGY